ncbi:hypothetical protein JTB14_018751 [Gonioctena quinquepunctata]|nr:hypothetical protein JTB14_018751 [Gonioctena quinquepunctata]
MSERVYAMLGFALLHLQMLLVALEVAKFIHSIQMICQMPRSSYQILHWAVKILVNPMSMMKLNDKHQQPCLRRLLRWIINQSSSMEEKMQNLLNLLKSDEEYKHPYFGLLLLWIVNHSLSMEEKILLKQTKMTHCLIRVDSIRQRIS